MLAADGERLARNSSCQELNVFRKGSEIESANIAFVDGPSVDFFQSVLIFAQGLARLFVPLDNRQMLETRA
jgi:hypothetical protein